MRYSSHEQKQNYEATSETFEHEKKKNFEATSETFGLLSRCAYYMTLDPRSPFPDSVGGIIPGPATTQKVYQGIEWFSQLAGLQLQ